MNNGVCEFDERKSSFTIDSTIPHTPGSKEPLHCYPNLKKASSSLAYDQDCTCASTKIHNKDNSMSFLSSPSRPRKLGSESPETPLNINFSYQNCNSNHAHKLESNKAFLKSSDENDTEHVLTPMAIKLTTPKFCKFRSSTPEVKSSLQEAFDTNSIDFCSFSTPLKGEDHVKRKSFYRVFHIKFILLLLYLKYVP